MEPCWATRRKATRAALHTGWGRREDREEVGRWGHRALEGPAAAAAAEQTAAVVAVDSCGRVEEVRMAEGPSELGRQPAAARGVKRYPL